MNPTIYPLPRTDKIIDIHESDIQYDDYPSPKLLKYGFNNVNEQLDMVALTSVPYYRSGLNFDFERTDESSIRKKGNEFFKTKNFNSTFAEFWEILTMFNILNVSQTIYTINKTIVEDVVDAYNKIYKSTTNTHVISDSKKKSNQNFSLIICKYSDIDIDENAIIQLILTDISFLLSTQTTGSNMIIQLFSLQTQTSAEMIYFLSSFYDEGYLIKPIIMSCLSDSKYLVLINFKGNTNFSLPKFFQKKNTYLSSFGLGTLPDDLTTIIQCMNSEIIPERYKRYNLIKTYLNGKVYEGATYQEMIQNQNSNTNAWFEIFTNASATKKLLDNALKQSDTKCIKYSQLVKLF